MSMSPIKSLYNVRKMKYRNIESMGLDSHEYLWLIWLVGARVEYKKEQGMGET